MPGQITTRLPGNYANVRIEEMVGLDHEDAARANAGFILQATGPSGFQDSDVGLTSFAFRISRSIGGIIQDSSSVMAIPDFDPINENYRLIFKANGINPFASLTRLRVSNAVVTGSLIGTLSRTETALPTEQAGRFAFSAFGNSAFLDDMTVSQIPVLRASSVVSLALLTLLPVTLRCSARGNQ